MDFLVARYGEFVLLKPRFNPHTLLLWLLPPLALAGGGAGAVALCRPPPILLGPAERRKPGWNAADFRSQRP